MRLSDLLPELTDACLLGDAETEVSSIVYDSRRAAPGALFVALPGGNTDGHDFLKDALHRKASAVAVQADRARVWRDIVDAGHVPALVVDNTRPALAVAAAAFHGHPSRRLGLIGVTGTDGKTSLCHLIDHILWSSGEKCGLITTAECRLGGRPLMDTGRFTTPEAPELQAMLRDIADAGARWAVVEATSHGLAQHRLDACEFDIAAMTTVTADHLDFHGSLQGYLAAKGRLIQMLGAPSRKGIRRTAVLNADDPASAYFQSLSDARVLAYATSASAEVRATEVSEEGWSSRFTLETPSGSAKVTVNRPGLFNVSNALAATAVCLAAGLTLDRIVEALPSWQGAPGRMQLIDEGQHFTVVVDFAHAPDSLRRVLELLRARSRGRIIAVFGCIGERDKDRRPAMGRVAADMADYTIVTDDNPYSEDREAVIHDIAGGLLGAGKREGHDFSRIADRREAIAHALAMAVDGDVVLLAGKGHETEVHLPDGVYECDDRLVARRLLREIVGA